MLKTTNLMINLLEQVTLLSLRLGLLKMVSSCPSEVSASPGSQGQILTELEFIILTHDTSRKSCTKNRR